MISFQQLKRALKQPLVDGYPQLKVALLGDSATQLLSVALRGMAVQRGYRIDLLETDYNQVEQQLLDVNSDYHSFNAGYSVIFQSTHRLLETYNKSDSQGRLSLADERLNFIRSLCASAEGTVIYLNYPEIDDCVFGSYSNRIEESFIYQTRKLNFGLMKLSAEIPNLFICDIAGLQAKLGRDFMFNPSIYSGTDMVLSIDALPFVASRICDIVFGLEGKFKKCLILDLDNTLWGGIVGDDGWENLQIGHGLGIGRVFTEFQEWVKKLKQRGIIICVCSKNDENVAKEAFLKNPEMVLSLDDISVFVANWKNKDENIRTIREILNIGFDSMVFLDDSPFERDLVRGSIPEICVPELPEDPALYLEYLYSLNLFETTSYSQTDSDRARMYQNESKRVIASKTFASAEDFLKSLGMFATVSDFNSYNIPRVAQLTQRSNQFNLRTVRYSTDQIREIAENRNCKGFAFSLSDKFGDDGLVSVVILKPIEGKTDALFIDTWLMSCRVLKRGVEHFVLNEIVSWAKSNGFTRLIGEYLPTSKNRMVADFYESVGFIPICKSDCQQMVLDLNNYVEKECFISKSI